MENISNRYIEGKTAGVQDKVDEPLHLNITKDKSEYDHNSQELWDLFKAPSLRSSSRIKSLD